MTTDQLIQQTKDTLEERIVSDPIEANTLAQVLETLVNVKRMEQFIEQEKNEHDPEEENNG